MNELTYKGQFDVLQLCKISKRLRSRIEICTVVTSEGRKLHGITVLFFLFGLNLKKKPQHVSSTQLWYLPIVAATHTVLYLYTVNTLYEYYNKPKRKITKKAVLYIYFFSNWQGNATTDINTPSFSLTLSPTRLTTQPPQSYDSDGQHSRTETKKKKQHYKN